MKLLCQLYVSAFCTVLPICAFAEEDYATFELDGIKYTIYSEPSESNNMFGSVNVSPVDKNIYGDVKIPLYIENGGKTYRVESVSEFSNCNQITSVSIPLRVNIEWEAFENCEVLSYVSLRSVDPNTSDELYGKNYQPCISPRAFAGCYNLREIDVDYDECIQDFEVGYQAFVDCSSLASFDLHYPESVLSGKSIKLGDEIFLNCTKLESVIVDYYPSETLPYALFKNCEALSEVCFPNSYITEISESCFENCMSLRNFEFISNVSSILKNAFSGCSSITKLDLQSVEYIGENAFYGCSGISEISIPNVQYMGMYAFKGCSGLTRLDIPLSLEGTIGMGCFQDCVGLTEVEVYEGIPNPDTKLSFGGELYVDGVYSGFPGVFEGCVNLVKVIIPQTCGSIGYRCFAECESLKEVYIPTSVETICTESFYRCYGLENIEIPESVKIIGHGAFQACLNLQDINLPDSVEEIYGSAFYGCQSLRSIVIPGSVKFIGLASFACAGGISWWPAAQSDIYYYTDNPLACDGAFEQVMYENATLHYLEGYLEKYEATSPWKNFLNKVEGVSAGIEEISDISEEMPTVYTLDGVHVKNTWCLSPGTYIVKTGNKTEKIIIR